ncbi:hypothetical protein B0H11DRAFT_2260335 [Mycena galericulata]|nr:hypothetical protein B0H11DRAFT_2260335 [Mycena galericulata]
MLEAHRDVSVPLTRQFEHKPSHCFAPIHEIAAGRNRCTKQFYWKLWYGDDAVLPYWLTFDPPDATVLLYVVSPHIITVENTFILTLKSRHVHSPRLGPEPKPRAHPRRESASGVVCAAAIGECAEERTRATRPQDAPGLGTGALQARAPVPAAQLMLKAGKSPARTRCMPFPSPDASRADEFQSLARKFHSKSSARALFPPRSTAKAAVRQI